jgi:DNA-binding transcriptional LysR family regulator
MHYDLKHLRVFVAVAEELNFHRAAERLSMAQPAVSRIISELELRLGVQLLERTTRMSRLTDAGRYLLRDAREILDQVVSAEKNVRLIADGTKAILKIGYTTINGHALLAEVIKLFYDENPEVKVKLTYLPAPDQRDMILTGAIDAGFMEGSITSTEISSRIVARHRLMVLMSKDHPLAARDMLSVSDIGEHNIIMGTNDYWPTLRSIVTDVFIGAGESLKISHEAPTLTSIFGLVASGLGLTVFAGMPNFCGGDMVASPLVTRPSVLVESHLAWRRSNANVALSRFREVTLRVSKERYGLSV